MMLNLAILLAALLAGPALFWLADWVDARTTLADKGRSTMKLEPMEQDAGNFLKRPLSITLPTWGWGVAVVAVLLVWWLF